MRILWLTNYRPVGTIDYYGPLMEAVGRRTEVTVVRRHYEETEGDWCRQVMLSKRPCVPILDINQANGCDVVVCDAMYSYMTEPWERITRPLKAVFLGDMHGQMVQEYAGAAWARFGFRLFLPIYREGMRRYHPDIWASSQVQIAWFPYWVDQAVYRDYELPRDVACLTTGTSHPVVYALRDRIHRAMTGFDGYKCLPKPVEKPGSTEVWPLGEAYARELGRARMAFACTSVYSYPVTKLYEICACRTALACDWIDEMGDLGWQPDVNMVPLSLNDLDLRGTVEKWLARPDRLQAIADAGYQLVHERYGVEQRAGELLGVLEKALEGSVT